MEIISLDFLELSIFYWPAVFCPNFKFLSAYTAIVTGLFIHAYIPYVEFAADNEVHCDGGQTLLRVVYAFAVSGILASSAAIIHKKKFGKSKIQILIKGLGIFLIPLLDAVSKLIN